MTHSMPASQILVANRHRRDHGDLQALAESIQDVGLLHPVVVTPDGVLIAGGRRYTAVVDILGWVDVPVRVIEDLDDAGRVLAERDENTQRKALTPTEAESLATAIEAELRPMAEQRRKEHGGSAPGKPNTSANLTEVLRAPETRHIAASAAGLGATTIAKVRAVKAVAEDLDALAPLRKVAADALEEMDRTGKVDHAYKKVKAAAAGDNEAPPNTDVSYLAAFARSIARADDFLTFVPERIAALDRNGDHVTSVEQLCRSITAYREKMRAARTGLRVVNGEKR